MSERSATSVRKTLLLFALGGLSIAAIWSYLSAITADEALDEAMAQTRESRRLVAEIIALREARPTATTQVVSQDETVRGIEAAALRAGLPAGRILRIVPSGPQQRHESDYVQQSIDVTIAAIELSQLFTFLRSTEAGEQHLRTTSLRLAPPRTSPGDAKTETWRAEITLSYLIYRPERTPRNDRPK